MKRFKNGDILIKDKADYYFEYDTKKEKDVSVVDCIQDAKAAELALLYLYGVVCKGKKVDGGMFPTNPFSNSDMNDYFDAIMRKLGESEGNGSEERKM